MCTKERPHSNWVPGGPSNRLSVSHHKPGNNSLLRNGECRHNPAALGPASRDICTVNRQAAGISRHQSILTSSVHPRLALHQRATCRISPEISMRQVLPTQACTAGRVPNIRMTSVRPPHPRQVEDMLRHLENPRVVERRSHPPQASPMMVVPLIARYLDILCCVRAKCSYTRTATSVRSVSVVLGVLTCVRLTANHQVATPDTRIMVRWLCSF